MPEQVFYLPDSSVSGGLNRALIELLSVCFTKPQDEVFRHRRYFHEMPSHRFLIPASENRGRRPEVFTALAGHLAIHERVIRGDGQDLRCGGVAEVAVAPPYRGRGFARLLLHRAHAWLEEQGFDFAILFGDPALYRRNGYRIAENRIRYLDFETGSARELSLSAGTDPSNGSQAPDEGAFLYRPLSRRSWPSGIIDLQGYRF